MSCTLLAWSRSRALRASPRIGRVPDRLATVPDCAGPRLLAALCAEVPGLAVTEDCGGRVAVGAELGARRVADRWVHPPTV
jgi:hypothetical protein